MGGPTGSLDLQREIAEPRFLISMDRLLRYVPVVLRYWWRTRQVTKVMGYAR